MAAIFIGYLLSMVVLCSAKLPQFSWDTVPVFFHSGNESGLYSQEGLQTMAKFQMVTIEKFQSYQVQGIDDEDDMVAVMKAVKKINPNVATYFYMNSYKDRPEMTRMARELEQHQDWFLRNEDGIKVKNNGQGYYVFDLSKPDVRQWWQDTCLRAIKDADGDGCYCDSSDQRPVKFTPPLSDAIFEKFEKGLLDLTRDVQSALGDDKLLIGKVSNQSFVKSVQIEFFHPNNDSINELMLGVTNGKVMQAHVPVQVDCTGDLTNYLAAFLIGAGDYSYFGCGKWNTIRDDKTAMTWKPEYDKPLGAPRGPAIYNNGVWKREFAKGTSVMFDTTSNTGTIQWGTE